MNGKIVQTSIGKIRDAEKNTRNAQVQFTEEKDVQEVQLNQLSGFQSNPESETIVFVVENGVSYKISIAENDGVEPQNLETGERIVYSSDGGTIKSFIKFLKTGVLQLNGSGDFAVRFNALETEFNKLRDDYNVHKHTGVQTGSGTSGPTDTANTSDLAPAKISEIEVPS